MDIDGDGHRDILSGTYSRQNRGMAGLFYVLHGNDDRTFRKAEVLKGTDGEPLVIPADGEERETEKICTRPFATDWDGDGHLDLVVGNFSGTFYLFRGEDRGRFAPKPTQLMAGNQPLRLPEAHSDPFVVDWDGDGDPDLLSGSSRGGVYWAENAAGPGKPPDLKPFRPLVAAPANRPADGKPVREADLTGPAQGTRVWAADVDGDGKLDLLIGDDITLVSPAKGLSEAEMAERYAEWKKEFKAAMDVYRKAADAKDDKARAKASEAYQKVYDRRSEFMVEDRTGYVWLYRRK